MICYIVPATWHLSLQFLYICRICHRREKKSGEGQYFFLVVCCFFSFSLPPSESLKLFCKLPCRNLELAGAAPQQQRCLWGHHRVYEVQQFSQVVVLHRSTQPVRPRRLTQMAKFVWICFWLAVQKLKFFVKMPLSGQIVEIWHCSSSSPELYNTWSEQFLRKWQTEIVSFLVT